MPDINEQLKVCALTCSLKPSPEPSSTDTLTRQVLDALMQHGAETEMLRIADYVLMPGVQIDMGEGDQWPELREKIMQADIFILASPTWVGHMSSIAQRVIERLDAELSETDEEGRLQTFGKVAGVVVVGNEDGAHKVTADIMQALNDVGFTLPANGGTYWNGEAMHTTDYIDLDEIPEKTAQTNKTMAANLAHLARLLKTNRYPPALTLK